MLDPLSAGSGVLASFPQHAIPVYQGGVFRLRSALRISRLEFRMLFSGSQSNALIAADYYNFVRIAVIKTGKTYANSNVNYLSNVYGGTSMQDTQQVLADKTVGLTTQAFSSTDYNSPGLADLTFAIDCSWDAVFYSTTATGAGTAWENQEGDIMLEFVSDSSVAPHPQVSFSCRVFFDFLKN